MSERSNTKELQAWINNELKPNIYIVATLKQRKMRSDGYWEKGSLGEYEKAYDKFIVRLTKLLYGERNYRRHKKLIPNMATLEGGDDIRWHININFRRPEWIDFLSFKAMFIAVWMDTKWAMPDLYIEESHGNAVAYSLKEGPEALFVKSMSF